MIKITFLIIFLTIANYSQTDELYSDLFSQRENIIKFADFLFCEKDYLRSADEYLRINEKARDENINFRLALSLSAIGNYDPAKNIFEQIKENSLYFQSSRLEILKVLFLEGRYPELRDFAVSERNLNLFENNISARKIYFLSYLKDQQLVPPFQEFIKPFDVVEKKEVETLYKTKVEPPNKNPLLASILSAIIPGAGKIYTSDTGDGIIAFLLTGLYTFLSYDNFRANHDFKGWLFGSLAVMFYAGNVYGSYASAQKYNARIVYEFSVSLDSFLKSKNYFMPDYEFCK